MNILSKRLAKVLIALGLGLAPLLLLGGQLVLATRLANLMTASWPTLTPMEVRFQAMQITAEDLPSGWSRGGIRIEEVPGAEARFLWYYGPPGESKTWVNVSQKLILYADQKTAAKAYDDLLAEYSDGWIAPPGLEFTSQADQFYVVCLPAHIDGISSLGCRAIGRYEDVIISLRANVFEDRWLMMEDFQRVLEAMDRCIVTVNQGDK